MVTCAAFASPAVGTAFAGRGARGASCARGVVKLATGVQVKAARGGCVGVRCEGEKFAKPQPGDPDFDGELPKASEMDLDESATGEGLAAQTKKENEPAWMDASSFKEASDADKENATTGLDLSDEKGN